MGRGGPGPDEGGEGHGGRVVVEGGWRVVVVGGVGGESCRRRRRELSMVGELPLPEGVHGCRVISRGVQVGSGGVLVAVDVAVVGVELWRGGGGVELVM